MGMAASYVDNAFSDFHMTVMEAPTPSYAPRRPAPIQYLRAINPSTQALVAEMKSKIAANAQLEANWDGYGAIRVNPAAIAHATAAASLLFLKLPAAYIFANPNGTITFEWESPKGSANLEIGDTKFSFFIDTDDGLLWPSSGKAEEISSVLGDIIHSTLFAENSPPSSTATFAFRV